MKKRKKNIILLGLASFFNDISSEMIMPILPLFIIFLGGSGFAIGLIGGIRDSLGSLLKVFAGHLSDKKGKRKSFVITGYIFSSIFKLSLAFSKLWTHVLVFVGLDRLGKGIRESPRDAIISESMPKQNGRAFGIHRAFDTLGAIIGSLLALILFWFLNFSFRTIILLAGSISFLSLIPLFFLTPSKRKPSKETFSSNLKTLSSKLYLLIAITTIFSLANFSYMFFILRAKNAFSGAIAIGITLFLYMLFNIFYAAFSIPFGKLSDRHGRKKVLLTGYFLFALTSLGFIFNHSLNGFIFLFALYGIVFAIVESNQRAFVSDLSPKNKKATALGLYHTATGLAALPAGIIAGILWKISPSATFIYGIALSLLAFIALSFFKHSPDPTKI